jgi:hypothetical protein
MMGQAKSHKARISVRTGLVLDEGRKGAVGMSAGFYGWGVPTWTPMAVEELGPALSETQRIRSVDLKIINKFNHLVFFILN